MKSLSVTCACAKMDGLRIQSPESASCKKLVAKDNAHTMENHTEKEKSSGREIASSVNAEMVANTVNLDCAESLRTTVMKEDNDSSMFQDHAASALHTTSPSPHQSQSPHQRCHPSPPQCQLYQQPLSLVVAAQQRT